MQHAGMEGLMGLSDAWGTRVTEWSAGAGLSAYRDGVTVICELAAQFSARAWRAATPCAEWRAADLAGHLRCVADDYHEYLDEAPGSRLARLMASGVHPETLARKLARQNAAELAALPDRPAPEHITASAGSQPRTLRSGFRKGIRTEWASMSTGCAPTTRPWPTVMPTWTGPRALSCRTR